MNQALTRFFSDFSSTANAWLRDAFSTNIGLKGLSLLFALGLVAYQRGQQDEQQRTVAVGLVLRLPSESANRELMTSMPANIHLTVRGASQAIDEMMQAGVTPVELDLRDGVTEHVVFESSMFSLPSNVELRIIDPVAIDLEWEDIIVREIPIQTSVTGNVSEGYERAEVLVDPRTVSVRGPASLVEVLQFARLAAFDISGKTDGVYRHAIALDPPPTRVRYLGSTNATVTVQIRRRMIHQKFQNVQVEVLGPVKALAKPRLVDVTVHGPPEVVASLHKALIVPQVTLQLAPDKPHGSALLPVSVNLAKAEVEVQPPAVVVVW